MMRAGLGQRQIFICYRRNDTGAHAGRLNDALCNDFGEDNVFFDRGGGIDGGDDWKQVIDERLESCATLLVLIGINWQPARLADPDDLVRREISSALARDVRVIPILVNDATLPSAAELPEETRPLLNRQMMELTDRHWRADYEQLAKSIRKEIARRKQQKLSTLLTRRSALAALAVVLGLVLFIATKKWVTDYLSTATDTTPTFTDTTPTFTDTTPTSTEAEPARTAPVSADPGTQTVADAETTFWESVQKSNTASAYDEYLERYPKGKYEAQARQRGTAVVFAARGPVVSTDAKEREYWVDPETRLMWTVKDNGSSADWKRANAYCRGLTLGDMSGWRLASIDELKSLRDGPIARDDKVKMQTLLPDHWVWSSTDKTRVSARALFFPSGSIGLHQLSFAFRVLCVRKSEK